TVHFVRDLFGHAPNVATDHWTAVHERLLDHQRRVLPPHRRYHDPVDVFDQFWKIVVMKRSAEHHVASCLLKKATEFALKLLGLNLEICSIDPKRCIGRQLL